jgi:hypothetical protein
MYVVRDNGTDLAEVSVVVTDGVVTDVKSTILYMPYLDFLRAHQFDLGNKKFVITNDFFLLEEISRWYNNGLALVTRDPERVDAEIRTLLDNITLRTETQWVEVDRPMDPAPIADPRLLSPGNFYPVT